MDMSELYVLKAQPQGLVRRRLLVRELGIEHVGR